MWTIQSWYDESRAAGAAKPQYYRDFADMFLNNYARLLPGMGRAEVVKRLADANKERLAASPCLTKYPELRGMPELIAAQWRGLKDGAGLSDDQSTAFSCGNYYTHRFIASGKLRRETAKCSSVYFADSDHGPLFAANLDTSPAEPFGPPEWPVHSEHLLMGGVSSGVFLDEESPEIFPAPVHAMVARYCRTADEAAEFFTRYNHFWGPGNLIVVDPTHRIAMIEKTACRIAVRFSRDGFGFVTAMAQEDPGLREFVAERRTASLAPRGLDPKDCDDVAYWALQGKRHNLMKELLDEARKNPTVEAMRNIMQFRSPTRGCCAVDGEPTRPGVKGSVALEHTLRTYIVALREKRALWWKRDNEKGVPSWLNQQPDVHFKDVLSWA
jgi:hypothetical protein